MNERYFDDLRDGYDRVASEYTRQIADELANKPLDRELLDRFATQVRGHGQVCDIGTGPGHIAAYLAERGVDVIGVDLAQGMVDQARLRNPHLRFEQADMRALPFPNGSLAGITAFYSIIHIPRPDVVTVLGEFLRVLQPGGQLLLAFHIGEETVHRDEFMGQSVSLDFAFFTPEEMEGYLKSAGLQHIETIVREPYPDVEHQSRRCYLFGLRST